MDFYQFVNSRDIREHLRKLNYQFSSIEAAWLVWHSHNHSLNEKHKAWQEIIDTTQDCEIKERLNTDYHPSLHQFLIEIMEADRNCVEAFCKGDHSAVFSYSYCLPGKERDREEYNTLFSNLEHCLNAAIDDIKNECDNKPGEYLKDCKIKVLKRWIDRAEDDVLLHFNMDKSVWFIWSVIPHKPEVDYYGLDGMWFNFPTPFQKGDVIVSAIGNHKNPIVLLEIATEHKRAEYWAKRGDYTDMSVLGYMLCGETNELDRCLFVDWDSTYMDMEYFRGELTGAERVLYPLSNLVKGKISLDLFANAYHIILHEQSIDVLKDLYTDEGLGLAGLKECKFRIDGD